MRRLPGTPRCHVFSENGLQQGNFLKQKISQVKIKGFFCVLGEQVLPLVLFLSPVPPALQPPAHSPMSPGKPPSLHCTKAGSRVLPTAPPWALQSSLLPLMFPLQTESVLSSPGRDNSPLLPGHSVRPKVQQGEQSTSAAPLPASAAGWDMLYTCRQWRANT